MHAGLPIRLLTTLGALSMLHAAVSDAPVWAQNFPPPQQPTQQGSGFPAPNANAGGGGGFPAPGAPAAAGPSSFPAPGAAGPPAGGFGAASPGLAPGGLGGGMMGGGMGGMGGGGMGAPQGPSPQQAACLKEFTGYKNQFETRAKAFQALMKGKQKSADQACKLISGLAQTAHRWRTFVDTRAKNCGMPPEIGPQIKAQETQVATAQKNICDAAKQQATAGPVGPSLSEALGSPALPEAAPTKRSGGSTFDTINGNALAR